MEHTPPVPTEGVVGNVSEKLRLRKRDVPRTSFSRGHPPTPHEFLNRETELRGPLYKLLGNWKRVEMVLYAVRLQAVSGRCYASAKTIADTAWANEKTWDRCLAKLRSLELVEVARLVRQDNTLSTNLVDFSALWTWLLGLLRRRHWILEWVGREVWVKLGSLWKPLAELLPPRPLIPAAGAGAGRPPP